MQVLEPNGRVGLIGHILDLQRPFGVVSQSDYPSFEYTYQPIGVYAIHNSNASRVECTSWSKRKLSVGQAAVGHNPRTRSNKEPL